MSDIQIFISYAREDDLLPPGLSDAKGFVTSLYDDLSFRLEQLGASNIKLWRDTRRLEAGGGIDAGLQAAISHSSMLLVILSPNWLHRESTKNELELFADRWRSIGPERIEQRIVTVGKHFLSVADRPSLLRGQRVFDFFAGHGPEQEFFAAGAVRDERYHRQIDALARHLMRCAAGMSGVQSAPPQEFSPEVCDLFRRLAAAGAAQHPLAKTSASRADLPLVFINAHESDKRQAFELKERLGSRIDSRLTLALRDQGASAARVMADFRENVLECDALVTVWGNAPTTWIRAHQAEVRNLLHQRKKTLRLNIVAPAAALPRDRMRAVGYDQPPEVHDITSAADFVRTELEQLFDATDAPPRSLSAAAVPPVPSGADPRAQIDIVNVSAFAPEAGQAGDEVLVQVSCTAPMTRQRPGRWRDRPTLAPNRAASPASRPTSRAARRSVSRSMRRD